MEHLLEVVLDWGELAVNCKLFYVYVDRTHDANIPFYVGKGIASRVRTRQQRNKKHGNVARKHGIRRFAVEAFNDEKLALRRETELIKELNTFHTFDLGCNFTLGGDGVSGYRFSDVARRAMSEQRRGKKRDPEVNARQSQTMRGRTLSENHKEKIRQSRTGQVTDAQREALKRVRAARKPRAVEQLHGAHVITCHASLRAACDASNVSMKSIWRCCRNEIVTAGGYGWRYATV